MTDRIDLAQLRVKIEAGGNPELLALLEVAEAALAMEAEKYYASLSFGTRARLVASLAPFRAALGCETGQRGKGLEATADAVSRAQEILCACGHPAAVHRSFMGCCVYGCACVTSGLPSR